MKNVLFILLFCLFCVIEIAAQIVDSIQEKNGVVESSASALLGPVPLIFTGVCNYEMFVPSKKSNKYKHGVQVGVGLWQFVQYTGWSFSAKYSALYGKHNKYLEWGAGFMFVDVFDTEYFYDTAVGKLFLPAFHCGFRHQFPDSKYYFRTGIGVPESAYVGIGVKL